MSDKIEINGETYLIIRSSDVIEADAKTGKKYWRAHIVRNTSGEYLTCTESWKDTKTGFSKKVWSEPYLAVPKNVGKANETTSLTQAYSEFDSMVQKEKDKRLAERPMPMLAHTFIHLTEPKKSREHKIVYPAFVQPKFDGQRMLFDGKVGWSRGNKENIPEVIAHLTSDYLRDVLNGAILDGELIFPENLKINEVQKAIKKYVPGVSEQLIYRVYDIVDPTASLPFSLRFAQLGILVKSLKHPNIVLAETHVVNNRDEVLKWHEDFTSRGFEGTIIRNKDGVYQAGRRVDDLQKYKDFITEEFKIKNVIPSGGGSAAFVGKFVCEDEKGDEFESTATGSEKERREYLEHKERYIGKWATVKYRERSGAKHVPFHSNVLEIRDTKDGGY